MVRLVRYCERAEIRPDHFLIAQFEEWRPGRTGEDYPSPRYVSDSDACRERYVRWRARRDSFGTIVREAPGESAERVIADVLKHHPGMTAEDFFRDPALIRMLDPGVAKAHPLFEQARAAGTYADPLSRRLLEGYL